MTIFFNNLPVEVENHIFTFSTFKDLVTFSGVNKAAYTKFDNEEFFGKIFKERHPNFEALLFNLEAKITFEEDRSDGMETDEDIANTSFDGMETDEDIWKKHTNNNQWKVVCCVFQTGLLNFSKSFINEVVFHKAPVLEAKQRDLTDDLKRICGTHDGDPTSPIYQARSAHDKTKSLLGVDLSSDVGINMPLEDEGLWDWASEEIDGELTIPGLETYFNEIIGDRIDEFVALNEAQMDVDHEKTFSSWVDFDKKFIPVVNYYRYLLLEGERRNIDGSMYQTEKELKYIEKLKQDVTKDDSFINKAEKDALSAYFQRVLEENFCAFFDKTTPMTEEDCRALLPAFEIYLNSLNSSNSAIPLMGFLNGFAPRKSFRSVDPETDIRNSNRRKAFQTLISAIQAVHGNEGLVDAFGQKGGEFIFHRMLKNFADQSLEAINPEAFNTEAEKIQKIFPKVENMRGLLLNAIQERHGTERGFRVLKNQISQ